MVNKELTSYEEILLFKNQIDLSNEWQIINQISLYGGKSELDLDTITTYCNSKLNEELIIMINIYTKNAWVKELLVSELPKQKTKI